MLYVKAVKKVSQKSSYHIVFLFFLNYEMMDVH